jgi:hypothetical protein
VNPESSTETYAALKLEIENWRWAGVPFYLRAGKRLRKRATEITIQFKQPPLLIFNQLKGAGACPVIEPNLLTIRIQPDEGISLRFGAKIPTTPEMAVCPVNMDFDYANGRVAGRPDAVQPSRRRGDHLGAVYADSGGLGGKDAGGFPELFCRQLGPGMLGPAAGAGWACVAERFGEAGVERFFNKRVLPVSVRGSCFLEEKAT